MDGSTSFVCTHFLKREMLQMFSHKSHGFRIDSFHFRNIVQKIGWVNIIGCSGLPLNRTHDPNYDWASVATHACTFRFFRLRVKRFEFYDAFNPSRLYLFVFFEK